MKRSTVAAALVAVLVIGLAAAASASVTPLQLKRSIEAEAWAAEHPASCALLDNPETVAMMDGLLLKLAVLCERPDLLGAVLAEEGSMPGESRDTLGVDVMVNDAASDTGTSRTQSETSVSRNETTGMLCAGYNDSTGYFAQGLGFTGFSSSADGGATWVDRTSLDSSTFGDPGMVWRKTDGKFYFVTLNSSGLGIYRSDDDCQTFSFLSNPHVSGNDDKELMAIDNNPASAHYGRIYVAWTDFNDGHIKVVTSDNGTSWSSPVDVSTHSNVQGAWPTIAPNGDVYVAWAHWAAFQTGPLDIEVARSTNGGTSFSFVTNPLTGAVLPRAAAATSSCGRPALNGNIRYLPSPQIAVGSDGVVHVVYGYDPDGYNTGDVINVYYRRSTDNGATWGTEVQLNDDATTRDQFFPTLSVGPTNVVSASWYDRRNDAGNLNFQYYQSMSFDGGLTWSPNTLISDASSGVVLDGSLATCYHGDYDTQIQSPAAAVLVWADDRTAAGQTNPNVWNDTVAISNDFLLTADPVATSACVPNDATYTISALQFNGFTEPVTLSASGNPAGSTVGFSTNPVTPPGTSTMTIGTSGASAGNSTITVTGTSSPSAIVHTVDVDLALFSGTPGTPTLTSPANGAINVPVRPAFTWTAASGAADYLLEVATDAGFGSVIYSATVAGTTQTPGSDLPSNTRLYWRVTANNPCGSTVSSVFSFTTVALPGDCATGTTPHVLYDYGFESGLSGWTHSGTGDTWAVVASNPHSGTSSAFASDPGSVTDQRLVSPEVALPTGEDPVVIKFWHVPDLEPSGSTACYDGGILEVSTDGGSTWTQVAAADILVGPYTGIVSSSFGNPLAGLSAWCGATSYLQTIADVTAYAGQNALFRFRLGSDTSVSHPGWNLDDVLVQSCQVTDTMPFLDGFETGDTSRWSLTVP
jgi:hypothetical protein